jgi:hypothetical protein
MLLSVCVVWGISLEGKVMKIKFINAEKNKPLRKHPVPLSFGNCRLHSVNFGFSYDENLLKHWAKQVKI